MRQVYLNEYNPAIGDSIFLPYTSGLLQSYAEQSSTVKQNYDFQTILFQKDSVENIVSGYDNPDVVGFSTVIWNYNLSLSVAKKLKQKHQK